jgi:hypothetical protein
MNYNISMLLWPLLITLVHASDLSVERFCFPSERRAQQVADQVKILLLPADRLQVEAACFSVQTPEHRRELVQSYIRNIEPQVKLSFSSAENQREPCRLRVEKEKKLNQTNQQIGLGPGSSKAAVVSNEKVGREVFQIQTQREFALQVDQDQLLGQCRYINASTYQIDLEVRKVAPPITPPLPAGSVVVISMPAGPPVHETMLLRTSLQLQQGERIELGAIIRDLARQHRKLSAASGLEQEQQSGSSSDKVFLLID